jgi:hypothetical protein
MRYSSDHITRDGHIRFPTATSSTQPPDSQVPETMWPSTIGRNPTRFALLPPTPPTFTYSTEGGTVKVRRMITRQDTNGKSVVVSDEDVDPLTLKLLPSAALHQL